MAAKVFISYRRDDSAGHAGRLHDRLEHEFGRDLLFMDVDAIPLGVNFIKNLREEVAKCDVLLAVIGPSWLSLRDKNGNRRLDNPSDYVRIEIATALQRDIPVIPVLLDGAEIPRLDQLPKDLEELALRNGLYVRHASFHSDMDRLIAGLKSPLGQVDAPLAQHSAPQQRASDEAVENQAVVAAGARTAQQVAQASRAPRLWRAMIVFGGAIVLAGAIFGAVIVKGPPSSSQPRPPIIQPLPQTTHQPTEATRLTPQTAQQPPAPVRGVSQAPEKPPAQSQPVPQTAQPPPAPIQPTPKLTKPPFVSLSSSQELTLKPRDSFKECETCPEMVVVPAGAFTMGSVENNDERPRHVVTIARPFAVGKFEITVDQFAVFVKETGYDAGSKCLTLEDSKSEVRDGRSWRDPGYPQTGSYPVACVNWNDAKAYLGWLSKKMGKGYRLLTEAEWEYVARATTTPGPGSHYTFGDDDSAMCRYGNVADKTAQRTIPGAGTWTIFPCSDGYAYAAPVGSFSPNAFGLYDVHGNVWEWTEDCYNNSYNGAPTDGSPWIGGDCDHHVVRGGMWGSSPTNVRLAYRFRDRNDLRSQDIGFRVARTFGP